MLDESLLQGRELAVLRVAFDGANRFAVEACGRNDAGWARMARPIRIIDDDRATQALRRPAAELGAGHAEMFAQKIIHCQIVAHVLRTVGATVDHDGERSHLGASASRACLSMAWDTG